MTEAMQTKSDENAEVTAMNIMSNTAAAPP